MKISPTLFVALVIGAVWAGFEYSDNSNDHAAAPATSTFEQHAYFKDDAGNRVFASIMPPGASVKTVRADASALPYTPGHITAAYYYHRGEAVPADVITLARNYWAATTAPEMAGLTHYSFVAVRGLDGQIDFADCKKSPADDLCKPASGD